MDIPDLLVAKRSATQIAREWFSVVPLMAVKPALLEEGLLTVAALKYLLLCMDVLMELEVATTFEACTACITSEGPLRCV